MAPPAAARQAAPPPAAAPATGGGTAGGGTGSGPGSGAGTGNSGNGGSSGTGSGSSGGGTADSGATAGGAPATQGGTGVSGTPAVGSGQADANAFALSFRGFAPSIGLPKLPPLPATGVALPAVAAEPDGSFDPQLPFDEQVVEERVPTTALGPARRLTRTVGSAIDSERLARGIAGGLVLLLVTAHVRRWLAQTPSDL